MKVAVERHKEGIQVWARVGATPVARDIIQALDTATGQTQHKLDERGSATATYMHAEFRMGCSCGDAEDTLDALWRAIRMELRRADFEVVSTRQEAGLEPLVVPGYDWDGDYEGDEEELIAMPPRSGIGKKVGAMLKAHNNRCRED